MPLISSCDALYFPEEPCDNVISLKWQAEDNELYESNTAVIFKVKSTSPQLFHVLPRYGALLLADADGRSPRGLKGGSIVFGMRDNYRGGSTVNSARNADSLDGRLSDITGRTEHTVPPSGSRAYQERFAIEYILIKNEKLAYRQIVEALSDCHRLTETVRGLWSLVSAGTIPQSHLGKSSVIRLRAHMNNVVLHEGDPSPTKEETTKVVVPSTAVLTSPSLYDRISTMTTTSAAGAAHRNGEGVSRPTDALRALKEEINSMRQEVATLGGGTPDSPFRKSADGRDAHYTRTSDSVSSSSPSSMRPNGVNRLQQRAGAARDHAEDILMRLPIASHGSVSCGAKDGLRLYVVLFLMVGVYVVAIWMRRGGKRE